MATHSDAHEIWGCAKCATIGKTCCQLCEIFVTAGDKERISQHVGRADFWHHKVPDDPAYTDQDDDPTWAKHVFREDGSRPVLKKKQDGTTDCTFLTPTGCSLPMEIRPIVCRLYPYNYNEQGIDSVSTGCPAPVVPPGSTILKVLDMRIADAVRWHEMLYRELKTGKKADDDRPDLRPAC